MAVTDALYSVAVASPCVGVKVAVLLSLSYVTSPVTAELLASSSCTLIDEELTARENVILIGAVVGTDDAPAAGDTLVTVSGVVSTELKTAST